MFERYTERARWVIFNSRYMAHEAGSPEIETEHLLLGLLKSDMALARRFLGSPWAAEDIWREMERTSLVQMRGSGDVSSPQLSAKAKRALDLAAKEADRLSSKRISTEHLLLGLLCDDESLATVLLHARGLHLASTRENLTKTPHNDSAVEKFGRALPEDVVEAQGRIKAIQRRMQQAIGDQYLVVARKCSDEERRERDNLRLLYKKHGLSAGWIFD